MSLPEVLDAELDGEPAVAEVALGGDDLLVVTPSRTVVYRDEGLLSDEGVESYPHDAERLSLSVGRRKAKLTLDYGLDGTETLSLPAGRVDDAIHPILAGVLNAAGVTEPGETVLKTFRFSDLSLVVTSERLVKHIGSALWTEDFETFGYDAVTDVGFEEGAHATSVVITHDGRKERFKTPNDDVRAVREAIVGAVCEYHGVDSVDEIQPDADLDAGEGEADDASSDSLDFGAGIDPLSTDPDELSEPSGPSETDVDDSDTDADDPESMSDESLAAAIGDSGGDGDTAADSTDEAGGEAAVATATAESERADAEHTDDGDAAAVTADDDGFEGSGFESAGPVDEDLAEQVEVLVDRVERQERQIERQTELLETLIEELRRGR